MFNSITRTTWAALAAAACALASAGRALAQAPDLAPFLDAEQAAALEQGELVEVQDAAFPELFSGSVEEDDSALIMFLSDASTETAWAILTNFDGHAEFTPHMTVSEVRAGSAAGGGSVCYTYEILWIDSTNCFRVRTDRETHTLVAQLEPEHSDDRLDHARYFWHVRSWPDGRILLAYYQNVAYSGLLAAVGRRIFIGPDETAEAVRERIRRRSGRAAGIGGLTRLGRETRAAARSRPPLPRVGPSALPR